jgi:transcriptional regulator with XRE-family HTH domain
MTQKELAKLAGVKQPNVARLERADYEGYSFKTLSKLAKALRTRLNISLIPVKEEDESNYIHRYIFFDSTVYQIRTIFPTQKLGVANIQLPSLRSKNNTQSNVENYDYV